MQTQYQRMAKLLLRPQGATSAELAQAAPSLSVHKRLSVMWREKGWTITKRKESGKLTVYFGTPPKAK